VDYQIIRVSLQVGPAAYPRPAVVVALLDQSHHRVLGISSKLDLYRRDLHFLIRDDHPDFKATGLDVTSYVIGAPVFEVERAEILAHIGILTGELADEFQKWIE